MRSAAAARVAAANAGTPQRATVLRAKLSREGGRRAVNLTFAAEEWAKIEAAAGAGDPGAWVRTAMAAVLKAIGISQDEAR